MGKKKEPEERYELTMEQILEGMQRDYLTLTPEQQKRMFPEKYALANKKVAPKKKKNA